MLGMFVRVTLVTVVTLLVVPSVNAGLEEELVFYLTFDNVKDQTIIDESGNGLDAEIVENAEIVKGKYGDAIHITGRGGDCVNIPAQEKLKVVGEITMTLWVYYQKPWRGQRMSWLDKDCHTAGGGWDICYGIASADNGSGPTALLFLGSRDKQGNVRRHDFVSPHEMDEKKWHHVAGSYDGETMKIYIDGKVIGKEKKKFNFVGDNDSDVRIGCLKDKPHVTFVNGSIDEAAVWRRALSDNEIKQAMAGNFLAVSPSDKVTTTWADIKTHP
ncbi:hypothetical protein C6496_07040 [Candidatus Poribacteria bacterium]|nr:MAG: hypothetical protein C6496_07040 [Candidatus Poribacteria bacterium]